jgi:DNA-binding transcriptional MerR regulator
MLAVADEVEPGFWTVEDVTRYLGVPAATVRYWSSVGTGPPSFKIGRYRKYKSDQVRAWADAQLEEPYASMAKVIRAAPAEAVTKTTTARRIAQARRGRAR